MYTGEITNDPKTERVLEAHLPSVFRPFDFNNITNNVGIFLYSIAHKDFINPPDALQSVSGAKSGSEEMLGRSGCAGLEPVPVPARLQAEGCAF